MELNQLQYVVTVAELNSFSKAADQLFITQPTISQQIKKLENEIGFVIFERSTKHVKLTEEGEEFLELAKSFMTSKRLFQEKVEAIKKHSGKTIALGILPTFTHLNLLDYLHEFQLKYSDYSFTIQIKPSKILLEMLLDSHLDIIITNLWEETLHDGDFRIVSIFKDAIHAVINEEHPLRNRNVISISDLTDENLIILDQYSSLSHAVTKAIKASSMKTKKTYEAPEIYALIGMVQSNAGIGFLSSKVYEAYKSQRIIDVPLNPPIIVSTNAVYSNSNKKSRMLESLSNYIQLRVNDKEKSSRTYESAT